MHTAATAPLSQRKRVEFEALRGTARDRPLQGQLRPRFPETQGPTSPAPRPANSQRQRADGESGQERGREMPICTRPAAAVAGSRDPRAPRQPSPAAGAQSRSEAEQGAQRASRSRQGAEVGPSDYREEAR